MYLEALQSVIDSVELVDSYHNHHEVKQYVNTNFLYKNNKYVTEYISHLISFSPYFLSRWKLVTQGKAIGPKRYWNDDFKTRVGNFLEECYSNQSELRSVISRAINSYTSTNGLSAEQRAYLRQLQSLPVESQKSAIVEFINKEIEKDKKRKEKEKKEKEAYTEKYGTGTAATNKGQAIKEALGTGTAATNKKMPEEAENEANQKLNEAAGVSQTQRFGDIGQPLPVTSHPPSDLVAIHADPQSNTSGQATMPITQIRARAQNLASRGRQILRPATEEVLSRGKVAFTKTQPIRQIGNIGGNLLRQTPLFSAPARNVNYAKGIYGARLNPKLIGGRSGGGNIISLFPKKLAAQTKIWFAIGIGLFALIIYMMFPFNQNAALCGPTGDQCPKMATTASTQNGLLTLKKTGTDRVTGVGQDITYTITVIFTGSGTVNTEITDKVPDGTQFKSSDGTLEAGVVKWNITGLTPNLAHELNFVVTTTRDNFWAVNQANATYQVTAPVIAGGGPDIPPNQENCAGKSDFFPGGYRLRADAGNFGDPNCTMTRDGLTLALQQADSRYWKYMLDVLIPCESVPPNNPNSHSTWVELGSHPETDRDGVWGLFSMGRGKNGQAPLDHGDVNWPNQVTNAVAIKNLSRNSANPFWDYWACARINPPPIVR